MMEGDCEDITQLQIKTKKKNIELIISLVSIFSFLGVFFLQTSGLFIRPVLVENLFDAMVRQGIRLFLILFSGLFVAIECNVKIKFSLMYSKRLRGVVYMFLGLIIMDQKFIYHSQCRGLSFRGSVLGFVLFLCGLFYIIIDESHLLKQSNCHADENVSPVRIPLTFGEQKNDLMPSKMETSKNFDCHGCGNTDVQRKCELLAEEPNFVVKLKQHSNIDGKGANEEVSNDKCIFNRNSSPDSDDDSDLETITSDKDMLSTKKVILGISDEICDDSNKERCNSSVAIDECLRASEVESLANNLSTETIKEALVSVDNLIPVSCTNLDNAVDMGKDTSCYQSLVHRNSSEISSVSSFESKAANSKSLSDNSSCIAVKYGWLNKCGHVRKNWSKRWFVLDKGVLCYYKAPMLTAPFGKELKGEIHLDHFTAALITEGGSRFDVYNVQEQKSAQSRRKSFFRKNEHVVLEIDAETNRCALEWIEAINTQINTFFSSKFNRLDVNDALSEGWLDRKNTLKVWQKKWFILKPNKLEYFADDKCDKLQGEFHLHSAVRIMNRDGFKRPYQFAIMSKANRLEVSCMSESERQAWMTMIKKVCGKDEDEALDPLGVSFSNNLRTTEDFSDANIDIQQSTSAILLDDSETSTSYEAEVISSNNKRDTIAESTQCETVALEEETPSNSNASNSNSSEEENSTFLKTRERVLTEEMISMISIRDQQRQNLTLEVLRKQLREKGEKPLEFIPLDELQEEVSSILKKVNNGESFDEGRLDYLLHCLELNPEHQEKLAKEKAQWREEVKPYAEQCFNEMRGYIPSHVFDASIMTLVDDDGLSKSLAKRFFMKKCLMLVRLREDDISKMHIAELSGRFNPLAQGLDIVEMAAIYHALPESFLNDHNGKKEQWRNGVEEAFKKMYAQKKSNSLSKNAVRYGGYLKEIPLFTDDDSYHLFSKEHSSTDNSEDFLRISRQKIEDRLAKQNQEKQKVEVKCEPVMPISKNPFGDELKMALKKRNSIAVPSANCGRTNEAEAKKRNSFFAPTNFQDELKLALKQRTTQE